MKTGACSPGIPSNKFLDVTSFSMIDERFSSGSLTFYLFQTFFIYTFGFNFSWSGEAENVEIWNHLGRAINMFGFSIYV